MFVRCHSKFACHPSFLGNDCISFYGNHVTIPFKVTIPSFQIHFVQQKHNVQMAAVMMQVVPSFYSVHSTKSVHICANTYEKYLVSDDYCVAQHENSMCTVPNCKYHILLIAEKDKNDLMQKLDTFCFTYQLVDCLYTLFKYRFDGKIVTKNGQVFDNIERAVRFNQPHKTVERMPSIVKKRLLRKKYKRHLLSSLQKTISTQTSGSVFADRIEQVKKTKFEVEVIKIVDCFLDGYGNYDSNLVSFKIKSL